MVIRTLPSIVKQLQSGDLTFFTNSVGLAQSCARRLGNGRWKMSIREEGGERRWEECCCCPRFARLETVDVVEGDDADEATLSGKAGHPPERDEKLIFEGRHMFIEHHFLLKCHEDGTFDH